MEECFYDSWNVAEILHVSRSFAYLLMKRGDLPSVRMGREFRVKASDLEGFICERELKKAAAPEFVRRQNRTHRAKGKPNVRN